MHKHSYSAAFLPRSLRKTLNSKCKHCRLTQQEQYHHSVKVATHLGPKDTVDYTKRCKQDTHTVQETHSAHIYKASQPRGRASGSRAYGRQGVQGVIFKSTRHECSVFVNLPLLLHIRSTHQFSSPEKTSSHCGIRTHAHPFTRRNA